MTTEKRAGIERTRSHPEAASRANRTCALLHAIGRVPQAIWLAACALLLCVHVNGVISAVYCNLGMLSLAETLVEAARDPTDMNGTARLLWRSDADFAASASLFGRALNWDPSRSTPYRRLGEIEAWHGDYGAALPLLERWKTLAPTRESYAELGNLHQVLGNWDQAVRCWQRASMRPIAEVLYNGDILVLDNFSDQSLWRCHWVTNAKESCFVSEDGGRATLSYTNDQGRRDILIYERSFNVLVEQYTSLEVELKIEEGSYFTLETFVDDAWSRPISYYRGNGSWETIRMPISGIVLESIRISLSEPHGEVAAAGEYRVRLDHLSVCKEKNCKTRYTRRD